MLVPNECWGGVLVGAISTLGYVIIRSKVGYVLWSIDIAFLMQVFLYVGYLYQRVEKQIDSKRVYSVILMVSSAIIWVSSLSLNGKVDLNGRRIGNIFLYYLSGISGTLFWYMISRYVLCHIPLISQTLAYCGENSLLIMCIHLPFSMIVYDGLSKYLPFNRLVWNSGVLGVLYILFWNIAFVAVIKPLFKF